MNEVWDAWIAPGSTTARATVEAKLGDRRPFFLLQSPY